MGKALYRVYRSKSFDELIGQDHITKTLKNALRHGALNHAYLLTGPRGVGKTSVARILAYSVNNLPYDEEATNIDIIEIDAASNRRIDEIRELRDKVHIAPVSAKYKVYIIDEVHMLTKEAFNALLKTLEEPPEHVIFILATTEFYKLPETIISRCLRFTFKPVAANDIKKHLQSIAKKETIEIDEAATELIAEHGGGSFRDSISLLEQIKSSTNKQITLDTVQHALGVAPKEVIDSFIDTIASGRTKQLIMLLDQAYDFGANAPSLAKQLAKVLRDQLINNQLVLSADQTLDILHKLVGIQGSKQPKVELELILLEALIPQVSIPSARPEPKDEPKTSVNEDAPKAAEKPVIASPPTEVKQDNTPDNLDIWAQTLQNLKTSNNTLYSIARMAEPQVQDEALILRFKFSFHYKKINEPKNKSIVASKVKQLDPSIKSIKPVHEPKLVGKAPANQQENEVLGSITNIFGASEVLES